MKNLTQTNKNKMEMTEDEYIEKIKNLEDQLLRMCIMSVSTPIEKMTYMCPNCGHIEKPEQKETT
jgi:hypothetical protein